MAHCVYLQLVRTGTFKKLEFTSEKINILQTEKFKLQSKGAYSLKNLKSFIQVRAWKLMSTWITNFLSMSKVPSLNLQSW